MRKKGKRREGNMRKHQRVKGKRERERERERGKTRERVHDWGKVEKSR